MHVSLPPSRSHTPSYVVYPPFFISLPCVYPLLPPSLPSLSLVSRLRATLKTWDGLDTRLFFLPPFPLTSTLFAHFPAAMATIARHVIANEYSLADESVKTVSDSHESTPHPPEDLARVRLEESSREDSPSSTSSGQEPCDSTVVSINDIHYLP